MRTSAAEAKRLQLGLYLQAMSVMKRGIPPGGVNPLPTKLSTQAFATPLEEHDRQADASASRPASLAVQGVTVLTNSTAPGGFPSQQVSHHQTWPKSIVPTTIESHYTLGGNASNCQVHVRAANLQLPSPITSFI